DRRRSTPASLLEPERREGAGSDAQGRRHARQSASRPSETRLKRRLHGFRQSSRREMLAAVVQHFERRDQTVFDAEQNRLGVPSYRERAVGLASAREIGLDRLDALA